MPRSCTKIATRELGTSPAKSARICARVSAGCVAALVFCAARQITAPMTNRRAAAMALRLMSASKGYWVR